MADPQIVTPHRQHGDGKGLPPSVQLEKPFGIAGSLAWQNSPKPPVRVDTSLREGPFLGPTRFRVSGTTGYFGAGFPPPRRVLRGILIDNIADVTP